MQVKNKLLLEVIFIFILSAFSIILFTNVHLEKERTEHKDFFITPFTIPKDWIINDMNCTSNVDEYDYFECPSNHAMYDGSRCGGSPNSKCFRRWMCSNDEIKGACIISYSSIDYKLRWF